MGALTAKDRELALRFVGDAEDLGGDDPFTPAVLRELGELFDADWSGYVECERVEKRVVFSNEYPDFEELYGRIEFDDPVAHVENPLKRYRAEGHLEAMSLSKLVASRALRRTRYYSLVLAPLGITDCLSSGIPSKSYASGLVFDRLRGEFSHRDVRLLDFLRVHLARLQRSAETRRRLRATNQALAWTSEHDTRGVIVLGHGGRLEVVSPAARRLIRAYFGGWDELSLPAALTDWITSDSMTLVRRQAHRRLVIDRSGDALLLEETPDEHALTAREREILAWVARGKMNAEIAEALWIAPTTVRKHLENIYEKLGVRTRTAAAARFLGVLDRE